MLTTVTARPLVRFPTTEYDVPAPERIFSDDAVQYFVLALEDPFSEAFAEEVAAAVYFELI